MIIKKNKTKFVAMLLTAGGLLGGASGPAAADTIKGNVVGGGQPIANSTITLWAASAGAPTELGQTRTGADGSFTLNSSNAPSKDIVLYVVAKGGNPAASKAGGENPAITLMTVLGTEAPAIVTVNELTTVASVFTAAQFINGEAVSGNPLGLRIAAGNAPNLVDPTTGKWGKVLLDPLNSSMTTTMASLDTLGSLITAYFTVADDAWRARFLKAATPPNGMTPKKRWRGSPAHRGPRRRNSTRCSTKPIHYLHPMGVAVRPSRHISSTSRTISRSRFVSRAAAFTPMGGSCSMRKATSGAA